MFPAERFSLAVFLLTVMVLLATVLLVLVAVGRRLQRERHFRRLDHLRRLATPLLHLLLEGDLRYEEGLAALERLFGPGELGALETVLLESPPAPNQIHTLRRLCEDLGLVKIWQDQLQGKRIPPGGASAVERFKPLRFLGRARAVKNLGVIAHGPSWPLLVRALDDPNPEVQWVAMRALSAIRDPASFPALAERLQRQALGIPQGGTAASSPTRTTRSAMIDFPLRCAADLAPLLNHAHPAVRLEAAEVIRNMMERAAAESLPPAHCILGSEDFPQDLAEVFLTKLGFDPNPDVRARAASVMAYLAGWRAESVLAKLLGDEAWFVRLHAARALAHSRFQFLAARVARLLTDGHWRVREAATQTLISLGEVGVRELIGHFFGDPGLDEARNAHGRASRTPDLYSREEIAEQMQRAGLLYVLADHFDEWARRDGSTAISQLARAGRGAYLLAVLDDARRRAPRAAKVDAEIEPALMALGR
ncbi:MAG TPA: HEAT repeat domain-containing protein [Terriglobia bacterium]|nr:HEAT repeat domain-containing protein [Terriglobia bacterium]